jgi:hypothetical protein
LISSVSYGTPDINQYRCAKPVRANYR